MRNADRGTSVCYPVTELVNRLGLMQPGQTQVIVRTIGCNVLVAVLLEGSHELLEELFATCISQLVKREVGVHPRAVPVPLDRLAVKLDVQAVLLGQSDHQVACDPHVVPCLLGSLREDLELPLPLGHFGVDPFKIDAGIQRDVDVLFDDRASDVTYVLVTNTGVIRPLGCRISLFWEAKRSAVLVKEILDRKSVV